MYVFYINFFLLDIDECASSSTHLCNSKRTCINNPGMSNELSSKVHMMNSFFNVLLQNVKSHNTKL